MLSETGFLERLRRRASAHGLGDDCAVMRKTAVTDQLITADMLVQDIDFRLSWTSPEALGHKALAVSLSDVAAMGGMPVWAMVSIGMPKEFWRSDFGDRFYDGWLALAERFGVELIGGDVSSSQILVFDSIVGGEVPAGKAVMRSTARAGDLIYVTGPLGGAAAGLKLLENGPGPDPLDHSPQAELVRKQLRPEPHVELGKLLREGGIASAMLDISDGLSTDLAHLCKASRVGAVLQASEIPIDPNIDVLELPEEERLRLALNGGEDFVLLFTAARKFDPTDLPTEAYLVGEITDKAGCIEIVKNGAAAELPQEGFQHF
jgi:thiamine-monophosphate kinase